MKPETQAAAITHACAEYPNESCGLIVVRDGVEEYYACRNVAVSKSEHFVISPEDQMDAEDHGTVIGVVHSHPDYAARPSDADKVGCEETGLPWYILSIGRNLMGDGAPFCHEVYGWVPNGYEAPLVEREFAYGKLDCIQLARDYYKRQHGIEFPKVEHRDGWWAKGENLYMDNIEKVGFVLVDGQPKEGDLLLMQVRSRVINHAAVYLGDGYILQHLYGRLSSRDLFTPAWREKVRYIARRKELM